MAGTDRTTRWTRAAGALLMALALSGTHARAAQGDPRDESATVRIGLPTGVGGGIRVSFGDVGLVVELPSDAQFPTDFESSSRGMLRGAKVLPQGDGRYRLELALASGVIDGVDLRSDELVIRLSQRVARIVRRADESESAYRVGPDDRLQISVVGHPDLVMTSVVDASGTVAAPLIGAFPASGLTVPEIEARITDRLSRDYLVDPRVDVQILEYRSRWAVVSGEVRNPGRIPLKGGTRLREVLAEAGGYTEAAGQEVVVSRRGPSGVPQSVSFARDALERGEKDFTLENGDLVSVPKASFVFVRGEVRAPQQIRLVPGLTLMKALTIAGDLSEWADPKRVQVLKGQGENAAEEYNLREIESGKAADPELHGGEIVIVRRRFL